MAQIINSKQDILTFGKHKGIKISKIDLDYIIWAINAKAILIPNKKLEEYYIKLHKEYKELTYHYPHWGDAPAWGDDYF